MFRLHFLSISSTTDVSPLDWHTDPMEGHIRRASIFGHVGRYWDALFTSMAIPWNIQLPGTACPIEMPILKKGCPELSVYTWKSDLLYNLAQLYAPIEVGGLRELWATVKSSKGASSGKDFLVHHSDSWITPENSILQEDKPSEEKVIQQNFGCCKLSNAYSETVNWVLFCTLPKMEG